MALRCFCCKHLRLGIFGTKSNRIAAMKSFSRYIYITLIVLILIPWETICGVNIFTPAVALFIGLAFALICECPYPKFNKKGSKYLLQASVVGLGFGMNLSESLRSGSEGMAFTIASVISVMALGVMFGYFLHINRKTSYLISSGTAICGGSAIAAVGPVINANEKEMAVSLGVIFILNAIALFIFPPIGHFIDMSETQFGTWAAIAIHDTSSVVGAGEAYGPDALRIATLIKLTRALWIIPLALITMLIYCDNKSKINIPWFIFMFIGAMVLYSYCNLPEYLTTSLVWLAKKGLVLTLFFIGASLSIKAIKSVGIRPLILAILLWVVIGVGSLFVVLTTIE